MAKVYDQELLSGSTNGLQIKITGTDTGTANVIHTAVNSTVNFDNIWLYVDNDSTSDVLLTIEWGGTIDPDNTIKINIPALGSIVTDGLKATIPGLPLNNALVVKAFASTPNVLKISGYVHTLRA